MLPAPSSELGHFLRSRRERLAPADVGLPQVGPRRRARGLRREEVAMLAGVSVAWYTYLEQGRDVRPSDRVFDAVAAALRLTPTERAHLARLAALARAAAPSAGRGEPADAWTPTPDRPDGTPLPLRRLLDALLPLPAFLIDRCWDVVGRNAALAALLPALGAERTSPDDPPRNVVEYALTDPGWRAVMPEWARLARASVEGLRASLAGAEPSDACAERGAALVAHLQAVSPEFRAWWADHGVWAADGAMTVTVRHPRLGALAFDVTLLDVRSAPGRTLVVYVPAGAGDHDVLAALTADAGAPP